MDTKPAPLSVATTRAAAPVVVTGDADIERAATVARWTDRRLLDPLVGLILPGAGDALGAAVGLYVVYIGWRKRAPRPLLARMLLRLSLDLVLGVVPFAGDVFDVFHRANSRNVELLRRRHQEGAVQASWRDWLVLGGAGAVFLGALTIPILLLVAAVRALGS